MKRKTDPVTFPPGHFTALIREHNWPPGFEPQVVWRHDDHLRQEAARHAREESAANGRGWGNGTITLPKTPKHSAPGTMRRST